VTWPRSTVRAPARAGLERLDFAIGALLLVGLGWYVATHLDMMGRPEEDAAMLLRYSRHLASGHGIVWNVGEKPVDGATDFLFMLLVGGLARAGLGLETAARILGFAAHAATVLLVYFGVRRLHGAQPLWALVPATFLLVGPALRHLAACYGTPVFALAALVAWLAATHLTNAGSGEEGRPALFFALAGLAMGLARPEGVFMLAGVLVARGGAGARTIAWRFLLVFLTLGLAYFLWRWSYFGYPLPNPFYKKGAGLLHGHSLRQSLRNLGQLAMPFLLLVPLGLFVRKARPATVFVGTPVLLFAVLFVLISDETNYVMRFRYPALPVLLVGLVPVAQALAAGLAAATHPWLASFTRIIAGQKLIGTVGALALASSLAVWQHRTYRYVAPQRMGLHELGLQLRQYAHRGYTLITTEAGLLPLYTEWRVVDAWGLNDSHIAHAGGIDEAYLERYRPEIITFHAYFSPGVADFGPKVENRSLGRPWYRMVMTLKGYAESRDYELAACFGRNAWDTHYYYVRKGFAHTREIVAAIRATDYQWDGEATADFAEALRDADRAK
jgi:arabinofuranosyltransferase